MLKTELQLRIWDSLQLSTSCGRTLYSRTYQWNKIVF